MRRMGIGLGVGINRSNYAQGIFSAYQSRVIADGGVTEAGACVDAVSGLLQTASLLLIPSGYKSGKAYAEIPTNGNGDLTWTRASTALRTNSSGLLESMGSGVPRLSYMYGSCPALLLEPQRTNLVLQSEDFSSASWTKTNSTVTANSTTSPDGTTNADSLVDNSALGIHALSAVNIGGAGTYTFSFYAKANTLSRVGIFTNSAVNINLATTALVFDLSSGVVVNSVSGITASIQSVGNGWYRCSAVIPSSAAGNYLIVTSNGGTTVNYIGSGQSIFVYGAQLELGAYPTTYIPTTTASATRIADTATKTDISSLIGQSEGVMFAEVSGLSNDTVRLAISDGTNNNNIYIELSSGAISTVGRVSGINQFAISSSQTITNLNKIAVKYKQNDFALWINGVKVGTDTSGSTYSANTLNAVKFDRGDGFVPFYGHIKQMILFTTALTDSQLVALTT